MSRSVEWAYWSQTEKLLNWATVFNANVQFQMKIRKDSRPSFPFHAERNRFTLFLCIERQRNVQRFLAHVHSYCSSHQTYLVAYSPPLPSSVFCLSSQNSVGIENQSSLSKELKSDLPGLVANHYFNSIYLWQLNVQDMSIWFLLCETTGFENTSSWDRYW